MQILVDMDGVIANFEKGIVDKFIELHPDQKHIPLEQRTVFYVKEQYPTHLQPLVEEIYLAPGFYRSLPTIPGSLEALSEMRKKKHDVYICTSPLSQYQNCVLEKFEWVEANLGMDWIKKIIITKDKTIVKGDILIDDKPEVKGVETPSWEHVLYTQPYNSSVTQKRRLTWQNWKQVLGVK